MSRILLTGGHGFIGCNFLSYLRNCQDIVLDVDKLTYASFLGPLLLPENYIHEVADISDMQAMTCIFSDFRPDIVINLAAESHVDRSISDASPFILTNVLGVQVLLDLSIRFGIEKFVQVSTDEIYGDLSTEEDPWDENCEMCPSSPYSASKASAELLIGSYVRTHGLKAVITRGANNYGPYQHSEKFIPTVIRCIIHDIEIPVYGDGLQWREWIFVTDHCDGIYKASKSEGVFNLGSGVFKTNYDVIKDISSCLEKKAKIRYVADRKGHDRRYALNSEKARKMLLWNPEMNWQDGIEKTVRFYYNQWGGK